MLDKIKLLLGLTTDDKDELILVLISICKDQATTYCNLEEYSESLNSAVIEMVIERYNHIGTEGVKKTTSSGVSEELSQEYSISILRQLRKYRKVKCV